MVAIDETRLVDASRLGSRRKREAESSEPVVWCEVVHENLGVQSVERKCRASPKPDGWREYHTSGLLGRASRYA